jgi:hypothetical protein
MATPPFCTQIQGMKLSMLVGALITFTVFSLIVVGGEGYFGFLTLAWGSPWGMQVFLDLCIALFLFTSWMLPDAKSHGISIWPYLALVLSLGSIGALAYLVHRELKIRKGAEGRAIAPADGVAT